MEDHRDDLVVIVAGYPAADGRLHRPEPRPGEPLPHRRSTSPTTPTTSSSRSSSVMAAGARLRRRRRRAVDRFARAAGAGRARTGVRQRALRAQRARGRDRAPRLAAARSRLPHPRAAAPAAARGPRATGRGWSSRSTTGIERSTRSRRSRGAVMTPSAATGGRPGAGAPRHRRRAGRRPARRRPPATTAAHASTSRACSTAGRSSPWRRACSFASSPPRCSCSAGRPTAAAADNTEQLVRVQNIQSTLFRADALATNAFLVGGLEPPEQRQAYDDAIDQVTRQIADAAQAQPADSEVLAALNAAVNRYTTTNRRRPATTTGRASRSAREYLRGASNEPARRGAAADRGPGRGQLRRAPRSELGGQHAAPGPAARARRAGSARGGSTRQLAEVLPAPLQRRHRRGVRGGRGAHPDRGGRQLEPVRRQRRAARRQLPARRRRGHRPDRRQRRQVQREPPARRPGLGCRRSRRAGRPPRSRRRRARSLERRSTCGRPTRPARQVVALDESGK